MRLFDLLKLSTRTFQTRTSRSFLTILGVGIGIGAILFLVSLGYGLQKLLLERITTDEALLSLDVIPPVSRIIKLDQQIIGEIEKIAQVEKISPQATLPSQITFGELNSDVLLSAVFADYFRFSGITPRWGKIFLQDESNKIVVSSALAKTFDLAPEAILGKEVNLTLFLPKATEEGVPEVEIARLPDKYLIIGVSEEEILPQVWFPLASIQNLNIQEYSQLKVKVKNEKALEQVREEIMNKGFLVSSLSETIDQANKIFGVLQIILALFGIISLMVAAIGLINTMTISLLERINEIGIMRAIGASSSDVKKLFLGESVLIGFFGGLAGLGIGFFSSQLFNWGINILARTLGGQALNLFSYPGWFIIFIIFLSTFVGFISGIWPARRAASLNPLQALRYK